MTVQGYGDGKVKDMKTTVIHLEGIESMLSPAGVEKHMCHHAGIHKVETNFMTGTATVYHDDSVTLAEIKQCVADCGYHCTGEALPEHLSKPGDPPMVSVMSHAGHDMVIPVDQHPEHAGHTMPARPHDEHAGHAVAKPVKADEHAGHDMTAPADQHAAHAGHAVPALTQDEHAGHAMARPMAKPVKADEHAGHETGEMASMAHEMGHGGSMNMA